MKKKTERKVKTVKESPTIHWSAFDEALWGPTKLKALLDEFKYDVEIGDCLSIEQFLSKKLIDYADFMDLCKKHAFLRRGVNIIKELIYAKRLDILNSDPDSDFLGRHLFHYSKHHRDMDELHHEKEHRRKKNLSTHNANLAKDVASSFTSYGKVTMTNQDGEVVLTLEKKDEEL